MLCHPVFSHYSLDMPIDSDDCAFVLELAYVMSEAFSRKAKRAQIFRELLSHYLGTDIERMELNKADTDGSITTAGVLLLNVEVKSELGSGSIGCTYIKSTAYYAEFIKSYYEKKLSALTQTRCPAFLLYLVGPHLGITGAAYIDKIVCDPLTPILPLYFLPHERKKMEAIAYAVRALKNGIAELKSYYHDYQRLDKTRRRYHQLQFPYIDSVTVDNEMRY